MPTLTAQPHGASAPSRSSFRPELQGLRALAVGLVLLFHLWPDRVSGGFVGVDVFFVVSGFLITGHLYRELSRTGTIVLRKFWARRIMRLLPLAFIVLIFSFISMFFLVPQTMWNMNVRQILGSLFYVENWVLAADSVDYMAADNEPSLVQHYWSLSIEEQFYVMLPLLLLGAYLFTKFLRRAVHDPRTNAQKVFIWTLLAITVATFIFSVLYTNYSAALSYFVTPTRFWEFSTGGLLAMLPVASKIPVRMQNLMGWAGVVFIVIAGFNYSGDTAFPGYTALLPVVGSALFIHYGSHTPITGIYWWASRTPSLRMGDWSYAIYLWHWPLIIIAGYQLDPFSWPYKLIILVLTFALAAASQYLIEDPLRHAKLFKVPWRAFTLMTSSMIIIGSVTFFLPQAVSPETDEEVNIAECTGANAFLSDCDDKGLDGKPDIPATQVQMEEEEPNHTECNLPSGPTDKETKGCSIGAPEESAEYTIAVIGDSHARAWLPLFEEIGEENNWNIQGYTKSGCTPVPLSGAEPDSDQAQQEEADACEDFIDRASEEFQSNDDIDAIITAASPTDRDFYDESGETSDQIASEALNDMWQEWEDAGKDVVVIGEVPHFEDVNGPTCVESNPDNIVDACSLPADDVIEGRDSIMKWAAEDSTTPIDFYDPVPGICDTERCYSMVGNLITRYDHHHLSADFARSFGTDFVSFMQKKTIVE